ncbi:MAG: VOC family protein [Cyanobacteriota bacterium]|nr:VOC family protein [Cyanobacteriota bacterium]
MGTPITGAIVLAADDPAALARFYGSLLVVEPQPGLSASHWRVPWPAGGWLELYTPSRRRPQPRQPGRLALCLQRPAPPPTASDSGADAPKPEASEAAAASALEAWIAIALGLGATRLEAPRRESFGAEAWLLDPEGNRLLLLVPAAAA